MSSSVKSIAVLWIQSHKYFTYPEIDQMNGNFNQVAIRRDVTIRLEDEFGAFR